MRQLFENEASHGILRPGGETRKHLDAGSRGLVPILLDLTLYKHVELVNIAFCNLVACFNQQKARVRVRVRVRVI